MIKIGNDDFPMNIFLISNIEHARTLLYKNLASLTGISVYKKYTLEFISNNLNQRKI